MFVAAVKQLAAEPAPLDHERKGSRNALPSFEAVAGPTPKGAGDKIAVWQSYPRMAAVYHLGLTLPDGYLSPARSGVGPATALKEERAFPLPFRSWSSGAGSAASCFTAATNT